MTVSGADGKTEVSVSGKEELKWIQYTVPEDGRYKIRFADAKNMARVDIYKLRDGRLTDLGGLVLDFNRNYQDFKKGDILYVRCTGRMPLPMSFLLKKQKNIIMRKTKSMPGRYAAIQKPAPLQILRLRQ